MTLADFEHWYRLRYHRTSSAFIAGALILSDLVGVMLSFGAGFFWVNFYDMGLINFKSFVTYWPYLPVFILIFQLSNLYPGISLAPAEELQHIFIASLMTHGGIILSRYIEDQEFDAISVAFIISCFCSLFILLFCRSMMHRLLRKTRFSGIPAVIYGGGSLGRQIADRLLQSDRVGYVPVLILDNNPEEVDAYRHIPIIHDTHIGPALVERFKIRMAIVAMPELDQKTLRELLNTSVAAFRYHILVPDFFNVTNIWMAIRDFSGILGFVSSNRLKMPWNWGIKRVMDVSVALLGGLILLPLFLLIALIVKISSPGPVLYGHTRLGRGGTPFKAYKFRSMVLDADLRLRALLDADPGIRAEWEASHKLKHDPRVTPIGALLRRTSLDEFPQLINILRGEMSLVGPRPIVQGEVEKYGEDFQRIFSVKPGLSGLWQVSGRSDTDYGERVAFDTYYLQSWSVWLDLWILYQTFGAVIRGKGAY
ncbi:MAG: undecaprenyl-phosphate galactose phosphotransferase WbaP [Spirochaetaceae bacterium]|nr:undecaprenyl-phosphate galactose phosphotransferase WbaP [Spirochaetaceae bacterium]